MKIKPDIDCADGDFDTDTDELVCSGNKKHARVSLCFRSNMHVEFAAIKLYSADRFKAATAVYDDALVLGEELVKRWNAGRKTKGTP